jgi:hypothetical protein
MLELAIIYRDYQRGIWRPLAASRMRRHASAVSKRHFRTADERQEKAPVLCGSKSLVAALAPLGHERGKPSKRRFFSGVLLRLDPQ